MIILGIVLYIVGMVAVIPILQTVGVILVVVGAVLWLLGESGAPSAGVGTASDPARAPIECQSGWPQRATSTLEPVTALTGTRKEHSP